MYFARFAVDEQNFVQVVLRVALLEPGESSWTPLLWEDLPGAWITQRVRLHGDQLDRYWIVTVPATAAMALQRCCEAARAGSCAPGREIDAVPDRASHDAVLDAVPAYVARVELPAYGIVGVAPGTWIGEPVRLVERLDALIQRAWLEGRECLVQTTFSPMNPDPGVLRALRRNELRLAEAPGMTAARLARFSALSARYGSATHRVGEMVGSGGADARAWIANALSTLRPAPECLPDLGDSADRLDDLRIGIDLADDPAPTVALQAAGSNDVRAMLRWTPADPALRWLHGSIDRGGFDNLADRRDAPVPAVEPGPLANFVFVSYSRRDSALTTRLIGCLRQAGIAAWWDQEIAGGVEWLRMLERRLKTSAAVVAVMSESAGKSRFVHNELTYAHLLDKPIVAVHFDSAPLPEGLGMVLAHRHRLDGGHSDLGRLLSEALRGSLCPPNR